MSNRQQELDWLMAITALPTAAGREHRVEAWVEAWVADRPGLELSRDDGGNVLITGAGGDGPNPLVFTAHMDHPAFVVEAVEDADRLRLSFRGSVHEPYFESARIHLFDAGDERRDGRIVETKTGKPFRECVCTVDSTAGLVPGDIGRWALPDPVVKEDIFFTHACDDLAALAAALAALDRLREAEGAGPAQVLLTRAEEIGFVGATAACKLETVSKHAHVINLENSRSFAESPIGGGPIVRVGDRRSTFSPRMTAAVTRVATALAGRGDGFRYQRRLMPGGTCEATVFCAHGYDATCVCLPLGNYHNMAELDAFDTGENRQPRVGPEYISIADYHGLVDLLVACGVSDMGGESDYAFIDDLYGERAWVLDA